MKLLLTLFLLSVSSNSFSDENLFTCNSFNTIFHQGSDAPRAKETEDYYISVGVEENSNNQLETVVMLIIEPKTTKQAQVSIRLKNTSGWPSLYAETFNNVKYSFSINNGEPNTSILRKRASFTVSPNREIIEDYVCVSSND